MLVLTAAAYASHELRQSSMLPKVVGIPATASSWKAVRPRNPGIGPTNRPSQGTIGGASVGASVAGASVAGALVASVSVQALVGELSSAHGGVVWSPLFLNAPATLTRGSPTLRWDTRRPVPGTRMETGPHVADGAKKMRRLAFTAMCSAYPAACLFGLCYSACDEPVNRTVRQAQAGAVFPLTLCRRCWWWRWRWHWRVICLATHRELSDDGCAVRVGARH